MSELLLIYCAISLAGGGATLASVHFPQMMPFADNEVLWKTIGFAGIGTFGTRFLIQWLYSEKHKESRVPPIFWWQSLVGTFLCLFYFTRQRDLVGVSGYLLNVIPYTRNLIFVYRKKRELAAAERLSVKSGVESGTGASPVRSPL